jgi:hypothetical protein
MDRSAQDHRWLRSLDADMERSLATGELRTGARDGEAHDEGGGIMANAPKLQVRGKDGQWETIPGVKSVSVGIRGADVPDATGILRRLECVENALLDSERQHRAACEREDFWKRRAERCEFVLFVIGLAALVIGGGWIMAKF